MHQIGSLPGYRSSIANDINDTGTIVGVCVWPGIPSHAFLYDGTLHDLGTLGDPYVSSQASAINNAGIVVGSSWSLTGFPEHAFVYDGQQMMDLNNPLINHIPGLDFLYGTSDINERGQIIAEGYVNGEKHAFLVSATPEPSTLLTVISGLAMWGGLTWRRHRRR